MQRLAGNLAIAHVRYPTVGMGADQDAQPFYINFPFGIGMTHNGNLTNWMDLKSRAYPASNITLESSCDVEAILYAFASGLKDVDPSLPREINGCASQRRGPLKPRRARTPWQASWPRAHLFAFRDPTGIKPCIVGKRETARRHRVGRRE